MPTVIDSLVVTLGLDPEGFDKGRRKTGEGLKKTREDAEKTGETFGKFSKGATDGIVKLRNEAIGLFLAFQGASSIKSFVSNVITGDASSGRLAANLGTNAVRLQAYGLALRNLGGDASSAGATFQMFAKARDNLILHGTTGSDESNLLFARMGFHSLADFEDPIKAFEKLAKAAQSMDRPLFHTYAMGLGIPEDMINLLELGTDKMNGLVDARMKDAAASMAQIKAAQDLEGEWGNLAAKITGLLRPAIYQVTDGLNTTIDALTRGGSATGAFLGILGGMIVAFAALNWEFVAIAASIGAIGAAVGAAIAVSKRLDDRASGADGQPVWSQGRGQKGVYMVGGHAMPGLSWKEGVGRGAKGHWDLNGKEVTFPAHDPAAQPGAASSAPSNGSAADRNNNPGNLMAGGRLLRFPTREAGEAAMKRQILIDYFRHGQQTVRSLINDPAHGWSNEWSPGNSHASSAGYVAYVARALGVGADARIDVQNPATMKRLMAAMYQVESGRRSGESVTIGSVVINAPHAQNADQIAQHIGPAIRRRIQTAQIQSAMN